MKIKITFLFFILLTTWIPTQSQPVANFTLPDSTCVGASVSIVNNSTGGSSWYWNFCSGNAATVTPLAINIGNPSGNLNYPTYITLVQDGNDCFSFVTNQGSPTHITRNYHGANFRNDPVSTVSLVQTGILHQYVEAIQIKKDGANWYGFVNNNTTILRLDFGTSLWNLPTVTDLGPFVNINLAHGLIITKEGSTWLGFLTSSNFNKLSRLNFGTSLSNVPTIQDLGNVAGFNWPCQISMVKENGLIYIMIVNQNNNTLSRVSFGNSLFNTPTGQNLGSFGVINNPTGITMINDCQSTTGYVTSYQPTPNGVIDRLDFAGGITGTITAQSLGNLGNLDRPALFSEIFRQNDSLFIYLTNRQSSTLTRYSFPPVNNATILTSTAFAPPAFSYTQPGTYHVRLVINEGQPDETNLCKTIVVGPAPTVELGSDHTICQGQSTILDAGAGFSSYLWSTGATTRTITVSTAGNYSVTVTKSGCQATDNINVILSPCATADFTLPDSTCAGAPVNITNNSTNGTTFNWSFCSGNASNVPLATNIGNPGGNMYKPVYLTLVQDGTDCFSFITNQGLPTHITRNYHGSSFRNNPVSTATLLQTGVLHTFVEAIQIKYDNGNWYGFVNNNTTITRLNFGSSLWNTPTTTDIGPFPNIAVAHGLIIVKEGNTWLGFFDSDTQNKLYRLNFGTSLTNIPTFEDLGNLASFSHPCQIAVVRENGLFYILVVNNTNSTISRVSFGTSLLNTPTGQNLGNCGAVSTPNGITLLNDCETSTGYYTVYQAPPLASIGRLDFTGGISGTVTATSLGNLGNLYYPHSFSEIFRQNDSLFTYLTNRDNATLTRFSFPPLNAATVLTSNLFTPPVYNYTLPGTYHVRLVVNEGLADEAEICKTIVVSPPPTVELGPDHTICQGQSTTLDAGPGYSSYLWSTGATSRMITVSAGGTYSVTVTKSGCQATDNVDVILATCATADFTLPDSACVNQPINITNLSTNGSTYYWSFCSGNSSNNPTGVNIGNPGNLLNIPTYMTLVKDGTTCYSFVSTQAAGVIRYNHGTSFGNSPVSWTNLGTFSLLGNNTEGIQVVKDNGNWYGFVCNNTNLVRLDFGSSVANTPTAISIPVSGMIMGHGLAILKEGNTWVGFIACSVSNNLIRLDFGSAVSNIPTILDFGNFGGSFTGGSICFVNENASWWSLVNGSNTLIRLHFGTSILNVPTFENLGNPGGYNSSIGLTLIRDCDLTSGYFVNYLTNGELGKLNFSSGIAGTITGSVLGNIGTLNKPHCFSEIFREGDNLYTYITNRGSHTLTKLTFPPCLNASVASSTLFTPPPFSYNTPGTYNVRLLVNEGLADQASICKTIVISDPPVADLGNDKSLCPGQSVILDAGGGFSSYVWSTGATTRTISVSSAGTYSVTVTKSGCSATDEVVVTSIPAPIVELGNDTTICLGQMITFDAGFCNGCTYVWKDGTGMTVSNSQTFSTTASGNYKVTVTNSNGCYISDSLILTTVTEKPVQISIAASATTICAGTIVNFTASPQNQGTLPVYEWLVNGTPAGTNSPVLIYSPADNDQVKCILHSSETLCITNNPDTSEVITMTVYPVLAAEISISGISSGICAGDSITYTATPSNGGVNPIYQWQVNGITTGTNQPQLKYPPADNDVISCALTSSVQNCISNNPAISDTIVAKVYPVRAVSVTVSAQNNNVCAGTAVTFSAVPQNEGSSPAYQWKVNGMPAGTNSSVFSYIPLNNDQVTCSLTSSETLCIQNNPATSNAVTMTVLPNLPVSVNVTVSKNPVCDGIPVTFTAVPVNGGPAPHFQWQKNGISTGTDSPLYTCSPLNNDAVTCIVTSSLQCTQVNPVTGNMISMIVDNNPVVTLPACFDTITTTNAKAFLLKGGIPVGGTYAGPGVSGGMFNPGAAGPGIHTISYSYTNIANCTAGSQIHIRVNPPPAFSCGNTFKDPRDNKGYATILLGSQCWMKENLTYGNMISGTASQRDNCIPEKYCMGDQPLNCQPLYQWDELMQYETSLPAKGLCPPGWHIPSEPEWDQLFSNWTNSAFAGSTLKFSGFSGFYALLSGFNTQNKNWDFAGWATFFWSSTSWTSTKAWAHGLNQPNYSVSRYPSTISNGFSVRCLKD